MRVIWDLGAVLLRWRPALLLRQVLLLSPSPETTTECLAWRGEFLVMRG